MIDLKEILAISGQPGLYKMVKHAKNSIIVESLVTGKRMPAYSSHKISALEDIAIFTEGEDILLGEVFHRIYNKTEGNPPPVSHKASANEIKQYFEEILPEYDKDRVYVSDMKRVIQWYNILQNADMLKVKEAEEEQNNSESENQNTDSPKKN